MATDRGSRDEARTGQRGAPDRVRIAHRQTRATLRFALGFIVAAVVAAAAGSSRWLPLHLFLAGGVVLAISGASLMLTVTWSAAPAPADRWVIAQRSCVAVGAAGIAVGREASLPDTVISIAGAIYLVGLAGLAVLLVRTVRRGVERRFDVAVGAYVGALAAGIAGVAIGVGMVAGEPSGPLRNAHVTVNLLGLVGLVIAGTMPFFAATVGRSKMSGRAVPVRIAAALGWMGAALAASIVALGADARAVAGIGLGGYALGIGAVMWLLPRPTRRQLDWAGPRLVALWAGGCWWAFAVAATAVDVGIADRVVFGGRWLSVLVIGGYAQILWGSLAYLLPVLRGGGHERLSAGFASTRSWVGLVAANAAALSAALALPGVAVAAAVAVWVLDGAWRAMRVR